MLCMSSIDNFIHYNSTQHTTARQSNIKILSLIEKKLHPWCLNQRADIISSQLFKILGEKHVHWKFPFTYAAMRSHFVYVPCGYIMTSSISKFQRYFLKNAVNAGSFASLLRNRYTHSILQFLLTCIVQTKISARI